MAVSVPKKNFRKAVERNLLKRRIREAYRLYKPIFYSDLEKINRQVVMVVHYQHKEAEDFHTIQSSLERSLKTMIKKLSKKET